VLVDGGGVYLRICGNACSWLFRWKVGNERRYMGLGGYPAITSVDAARERAQELRRLIAAGGGPRGEQPTTVAAKAEALKSSAAALTFTACAETYIKAHGAGWVEPHRDEWERTLGKPCDAIGDMPVDQIDTDAVMRVLQPIWNVKPEMATRLRGRIERVLDMAKTLGHRQGENPTRWKRPPSDVVAGSSEDPLGPAFRGDALRQGCRLREATAGIADHAGAGARALDLHRDPHRRETRRPLV
jgi:hypothetical protein